MESLDSFVSPNDSVMLRPIPKELRDACHAICVTMHRAETNGNVFLTRAELTRACRAEHPYMKQALVEVAIARLAQEKTLDPAGVLRLSYHQSAGEYLGGLLCQVHSGGTGR